MGKSPGCGPFVSLSGSLEGLCGLPVHSKDVTSPPLQPLHVAAAIGMCGRPTAAKCSACLGVDPGCGCVTAQKCTHLGLSLFSSNPCHSPPHPPFPLSPPHPLFPPTSTPSLSSPLHTLPSLPLHTLLSLSPPPPHTSHTHSFALLCSALK